MSYAYYVGVSVVCISVLVLLQFKIKSSEQAFPEGKAFVCLLVASFFFCLVDMFWAIGYAGLIGRKSFTIICYLYFAVAIITTGIWGLYNICRISTKLKWIEKVALFMAFAVQIGMLISNYWTKKVFIIGPDNRYITGNFRTDIYLIQLAIFLEVFVSATMAYAKSEEMLESGELRSGMIVSLVPIISSIVAYVLPNSPMYSWGFMISCVMIYVFSLVDTSDRNERERIICENQRLQQLNEAKSEFLSNMSHDIRTPMNAIIGMADIAMKNIDDKDKVVECLNKVILSSNHLLSLINEVLDMSKIESGKMIFQNEPFNLIEIMDSCYTMVEQQASQADVIIRGYREDIPKYPELIGSPLHIRQIFLNLCSNAIKYNRPGGFLDLHCKEKYVDNAIVVYEFIFSDTGIGMSEEFLEQIFEPFAQEDAKARTQYTGTGLGLSIVKGIVDLMGGDIEVKSKKGVGTTFKVTLPFWRNTEASKECQKEKVVDSVILKGRRVLLVEDNDLNMEIAEYILEEVGMLVSQARTGKEALDMFVSSVPESYDIILMDIMMPEMDGLEATRQIRMSKHMDAKTIPIIAMTANAFADDISKAKDAGMNAHLAKPLDANKVIKTICDLI